MQQRQANFKSTMTISICFQAHREDQAPKKIASIIPQRPLDKSARSGLKPSTNKKWPKGRGTLSFNLICLDFQLKSIVSKLI